MSKLKIIFNYLIFALFIFSFCVTKAQKLNDIAIDIPKYLEKLGVNSQDKKAHLTVVQNISKGLVGVTYLKENQADELSLLLDDYVDLSTKLLQYSQKEIIEIEHWDINNLVDVFEHENLRLEKALIYHVGIKEFSRIQTPSSLQTILRKYSELFTKKIK